MFDILRKLRNILEPYERRNATILFFMIICTGVLEAVGVASIMPFLAVLANPEMVKDSSILFYLYKKLNFKHTDSFFIFLGLVVFVIIVVSIGLKALTHYAIARFNHMRNYSLSTRLLQNYLSRQYSWFLNRHSADLGKTVLSEVQQVISKSLIPTTHFIANTVIATCLITLLLIVNYWIALFTAILLGGAYALIFALLHKYLGHIGADRFAANQERFRISQEVLGGIKEVKANGLEYGYLSNFGKSAFRFARRQAQSSIIAQVPQFLLQILTFGAIIIVTLTLLIKNNGSLNQILPTLGVFALAGQRLLPALNNVYICAADMRYGKPALDAFYKDFMEKHLDSKVIEGMKKSKNALPLGLHASFELVDVEFWYPFADKPTLKGLNINIESNSTVGIVGSTGAGKTTAIDLILGLFSPCKGQLLVDGIQVNQNNLASWQRTIGYVPQQIFLIDDTVSANIAFGEQKKQIDKKAVESAARVAELHEFVMNELQKGYETIVGERGVRLSGGQRQRIGIARALYNNPDVLIFDEATSALDNLTEKIVMKAVQKLGKKKTIILVAHRLSTVKNCDCIFILKHGRLVGKGTYNNLVRTNPEFQKIASVE